jgi:hypothetical protein
MKNYGEEPWFPRVPEKPDDVLADWNAFIAAEPWRTNPKLAQDVHFLPQRKSVQPRGINYTRIYDLREMSQMITDIQAHLETVGKAQPLYLPRANENPLPMIADVFDNGVGGAIRKAFRADFDAFPGQWRFADLKLAPGPWTMDAIRSAAFHTVANERITDLAREVKAARRDLGAGAATPAAPAAKPPQPRGAVTVSSRLRAALGAMKRRLTGKSARPGKRTTKQASIGDRNVVKLDTIRKRVGAVVSGDSRATSGQQQAAQNKKPAQGGGKPHAPDAKKRPPRFEKDIEELITAVRPYTMTSPDKLFALVTAVRHLSRTKVDGAMMECGVWRGGSMHAVARMLAAEGDTGRELYLFDTFEGMTAPTEKDRTAGGRSAETLLASAEKTANVWAVATIEDVRGGLATLPYPMERFHLVKGPVEQTIPDEAPEKIALLRLDTDWYESTKHELEHLYERLVPDGVLIIDDYESWQGSKQATDEFLAKLTDPPLMHRAGRSRIGVKPRPAAHGS